MSEIDETMADRGFRRKPDEPTISDLNRFLRRYGLEEELNDLVGDDDKIDVGRIMDRLPEEARGGPANEYGQNNAFETLRSYYEAVPPAQRAQGGVRLPVERVLTLLLNQTEYYHELADGLVRMCSGRECEHYSVCPFKEMVAENRPEDGIECMVDRKVIMGAIESFIDPPDGRPKVDTRQPAQQLLFEQLVQLLVKQKRITMHMQQSSVIVDNWEILQDGEIEHFDAMNEMEHALVKTWDRTHKRIEKVLKAMGISPRFEIQQERFDLQEDRLDAETRADQIYLEKVEDSLQQLKEMDDAEADQMSPKEAVEKALEDVHRQEKKLEGKIHSDDEPDKSDPNQ